MRVLLVAPDYSADAPTRGLVGGLVAAGHHLTVATAADVPIDERDGRLRVVGCHRRDPCPTHWMREGSVAVTRLLRMLLQEEEPQVVHVMGWSRLTCDPVLTAAQEGVPALVELTDHRATCLLGTRLRPESGEVCDRTYGPYECVPCAAQVPPHPTWVATDQAYLSFGERAAALGRELALARARLVPDEQHGQDLVLGLGAPPGPLLVSPGPHDPARVPFYEDLYGRIASLGAPGPGEVGERAWFEERMRATAESAWDAGARAAGVNPD